MKISKKLCVLLLPAMLSVGCIEGNGKGGNANSGRRNPFGAGPAAVSLSTTGSVFPSPADLGSSGNYVILSKAGIDDSGGSTVDGNMGTSPINAASITGFPLVYGGADSSTSVNVTGLIYAADYTAPTPSNMTTAISSMETAYTDAAGRSNPDYTEYGAGNVGGLTLSPGLYKWGTGVLIPTAVTLSGSSTDVWIFQIAQGLTMSPGISVIMAGGALPENVFWQVGGAVTIGSGAHIEGIIMSASNIAIQSGASVKGRLFAQTAVTISSSTIDQP